LYSSGAFSAFFAELRQDALDDGRPHAGDHRVVLQDFAADVQRQVFGIDHAAQEAQPGGNQIFRLVGDEHAFHV